MYCGNCGHQMKDGEKFCTNCGFENKQKGIPGYHPI